MTNFALDSINEIKRECNVLGVQNFKLIDLIAETRGLQQYIDSLEEENYLLEGGGLIPVNVVQDELSDQFDVEIERLQEILKVSEKRNKVIDVEKRNAEEGLQASIQQNQELDDTIEKLVKEVEAANDQAIEANNHLKLLDHEIEELKATLEFRTQLHRAEIENVAKYVRDYHEAVESGVEHTALPHSQADSRHSLANKLENIKDDKKLIESLEAFAAEYQKLLDLAFAKEKHVLEEDLKRLEFMNNYLLKEIDNLKKKRIDMEEEIKELEREKLELERQYAMIATQRSNDKKAWAEERIQMEKQIERIKQEIEIKERQLAVLVRADNKVVRETIQLEMEIQAYRAMMDHENDGHF